VIAHSVERGRIIPLAVREFSRCSYQGRRSAGHQYPLAEFGVVAELNLTPFERIFGDDMRIQRVGYVDDVAFWITALKQVATLTVSPHLHLVTAIVARQMGANSHIAYIGVLVEIIQAVWAWMRMRIGENRAGYREQ
jgi:hypothetical protein